MIQSDIGHAFDISCLGHLRAWIRDTAHLPDDTQISVDGAETGDGLPTIGPAKRTWRPGEQGCMVVMNEDGTTTQVDQTIVVIKETDYFSDDNYFPDDDPDDD